MDTLQPPSTEPVHVAVSKSKGIKISWGDGHTSEYSLRYLRDHCPCATCTEAHRARPEAAPLPASPFPMYQPSLRIVSLEPAGSYALVIHWSDSHRSGIYSYDHLRAICPCQECSRANG
ncbi:MAG: gamma-butyrobetaine hydroxylase-like domain-containing protein [Bryobacteraceae bacterium]